MLFRTRWMLGVGAVLAAGSVQAASTSRVPVFVNNEPLTADALMLKSVNRTVLPMRTLFESLGARVEWDPAEQAVYAWKPDGSGVRLALGYKFAQTLRMADSPRPGEWGAVTGTHSLDAPAMMVGSRVYVPIRFASEALKADVRYSAYEPAVHIRTERVAGIREEEIPDERSRLETDRLELQRLERQRIETERVVKLRLEEERTQRLRTERERADRDRLEAERTQRESEARVPRPRVRNERVRGLESTISVSVELPRAAFGRDEKAIPLRFVLRNESDRTVELPFASGQQFDVEILQEGRVHWNWAKGRAFTQANTELSLEPGEEHVFLARWNLRTNRNERVRPGRYLVRGVLTSSFGRQDVIAEEVITIRQ